MNMELTVLARTAIGAIISGHNVPEDLQGILLAAHDALLMHERANPAEQAAAFAALAGPAEEWRIA